MAALTKLSGVAKAAILADSKAEASPGSIAAICLLVSTPACADENAANCVARSPRIWVVVKPWPTADKSESSALEPWT